MTADPRAQSLNVRRHTATTTGFVLLAGDAPGRWTSTAVPRSSTEVHSPTVRRHWWTVRSVSVGRVGRRTTDIEFHLATLPLPAARGSSSCWGSRGSTPAASTTRR